MSYVGTNLNFPCGKIHLARNKKEMDLKKKLHFKTCKECKILFENAGNINIKNYASIKNKEFIELDKSERRRYSSFITEETKLLKSFLESKDKI